MIEKICEIALTHNPNKYVLCIIEFEKVYEIVMLNKGEMMTTAHIFDPMPAIEKNTYKYLGELPPFDNLLSGKSKRIEIRKD